MTTSKAGFWISTVVLNAFDFGVPQERERVIIIGLNSKIFPKKNLSEKDFKISTDKPLRTVREALFGLPEPTYFSRELTRDDIPFHPNHWCMVPKSKKFFTQGSLIEGSSIGRSFRTLAWSKPSPTVAYGNREVHVHPNCHRRLSVFEAMKLQGFPNNYELYGTLSDQITQISEAVPPPLAESIANEIAAIINERIEIRNHA